MHRVARVEVACSAFNKSMAEQRAVLRVQAAKADDVSARLAKGGDVGIAMVGLEGGSEQDAVEEEVKKLMEAKGALEEEIRVRSVEAGEMEAQVLGLLDTLRDLEIVNGTQGSDTEAAFAKVSRDVDARRAALQEEESVVIGLEGAEAALREREDELSLKLNALRRQRQEMQMKLSTGDLAPDLNQLRDLTDHISQLEDDKLDLLQKLENSGEERMRLRERGKGRGKTRRQIGERGVRDGWMGKICMCVCCVVFLMHERKNSESVGLALNASIKSEQRRREKATADLADVLRKTEVR